MTTNLTIKGIPEDLYGRLKRAAEINRRSINSEVIRMLERNLRSTKTPSAELLGRIRRLQQGYGDRKVTLEEIEEAIDEGRP